MTELEKRVFELSEKLLTMITVDQYEELEPLLYSITLCEHEQFTEPSAKR